MIWRIKPRYNADVNQWWISDDSRYSFKPVHDPKRLVTPAKVQFGTQIETDYGSAIEHADTELKRIVKENGDGVLFAILSPMMACEEA